MKFKHFILIAIIAIIFCEGDDDNYNDNDNYDEDSPFCDQVKIGNSQPSADVCKKAKKGNGYCCYMKAPKSGLKGCSSFSKYQYDNIDVLVKYCKKFGVEDDETEDKDFSIDCKSFYIGTCSLLLILFFL